MLKLMRVLVQIVGISTVSIGAAQQPSEVDQAALQRFQEGVQAWRSDKLEAARIAFQQAYALRPTPNIAFNLGQVELSLGKHVEAAQHLSEYLQQTEDKPSKTRQEARKSLIASEAKVGRFVVYANIDGADIDIDGQSVGKSPISSLSFYVAPGPHVLRARKEEYRDAQLSETIGAAELKRVDLTLSRVEKQDRTPVAASPSVSAIPASSSADAGRPIPIDHSGPSERTIVLATGAILTVAAATLGLVEGFRASSATNDILQIERTGLLEGTGACTAHATSECSSLSEAIDRHNEATRIMRGAVIATAVLGTVSVATWLLWPRTKSTSSFLGTSQVQLALPLFNQNSTTSVVISGTMP